MTGFHRPMWNMKIDDNIVLTIGSYIYITKPISQYSGGIRNVTID